MFVIYSLILTLGFVLMLPLFILRREKYASGFRERLGSYPEFQQNSRPVVWLHCVSVGETYAARPLVDELQSQFPSHRIIISTTTRTGHELARKIFGEKTDAIFYFPFDWKFSVRKALEHFRPSIVLLMETEIWPRFIREAHLSGIKLAIVNGRLSERSYRRYSKIGWFVRPVLSFVDVALMQTESDMRSINALGFTNRAAVTGNIKFDLERSENESLLTETFRGRFGVAA
jgi:3-deoxy-D-manno-octulosonic-acid transferase